MTRKEVSFILRELRGNMKAPTTIGEHATLTIESARASYPVGNMLLYCAAYNISCIIVDKKRNFNYRVADMDDVVSVLRKMVDWRDTNFHRMSTFIGGNFTARVRDGKVSLSIDMLLKMLDHLNCDITFKIN